MAIKKNKSINNGNYLSLFPWYEFGASIKNTIHQTRIKNPKIEVIIILFKSLKLNIITKTPKLIIDQGWHQYGLVSQKIFVEFVSIKKTWEVIKAIQY